MREEFIKSIDNKKIFIRIWDEVDDPKGVVQIFHGMAEHSERYNDFALYLNSKGYIVYADDHRGHGKSKDSNGYGYLGNNGFYSVVEDEGNITKLIKERYNELPIYIFAHSFGSFVGQEYITKFSDKISGVILSGSAKQDGIDVKFGRVFANIQSKLIGDSKPAHFIDKMSFGSFNKKVNNPKSKFDWLTRDDKEVNKYKDDSFCGFVSPINFYTSMFEGLHNLYNPDKLSKINKKLSIFVLSGDKDPVGKYGKSVERLFNQYKDLGIHDVSLKLYDGGRHEMLNETNKEEVYTDIYNWLSK